MQATQKKKSISCKLLKPEPPAPPVAEALEPIRLRVSQDVINQLDAHARREQSSSSHIGRRVLTHWAENKTLRHLAKGT